MSARYLRVLDRTARTALQTIAAYLTVAATLGGVDWTTALSATALAAVVALLQGVVDLPAMPRGWWGDTLGRAIRTLAQTTLAGTTTAVLLTDVPWETVLSASALAAVASLVTSAAAAPLGPIPARGTPELVTAR